MERQDAADLRTFIQRINTQVIDYLRFTELHQLMYECQLLSQGANEPLCMALEAVTCGGKSTLLRSYLERFPSRRTPSGKYVPVFYFETPASVTPKRMLQAMLTKLGDPGAQHGDITILKERLCWYLKQCGTVLVMMDDFHHLIDLTTDRVLSKVAEMPKANGSIFWSRRQQRPSGVRTNQRWFRLLLKSKARGMRRYARP